MRPQKPFPAGTVKHMEYLLTRSKSLDEHRRIQSIYFRAKFGYDALQVSKMVGLKVQTVRNIHSAYLKEGEAALRFKDKGGRHRFYLNLIEEENFLNQFKQAGELGRIVEISRVRAAYEQWVGGKVAKSTVYRLLERHGWRKLVPRTKHPKGCDEVIEQFKKNF